jgi:metal-dependent HD superfamily phosphatase/phosphodiesterase
VSEPGEPGGTGAAASSITLEDVQADPELSLFIASADRVMEGMGYTEHGFRHANSGSEHFLSGPAPPGVRSTRGRSGVRRGYLHDVGNMLTRESHAQTGAVLVYQGAQEPGHG